MDAEQLLTSIVTLMVAGCGAYLGSYLREKGKNRATTEDIQRLTRAVEDIKTENARKLADLAHQNGILIEQLKSRQQLRVAALDKRMQAHQEAFTLWRRLITATHEETVGAVVMECQTWWEKNSLYLEQDAREAFNRAYFAAAQHKNLLEVGRSNESSLKALRDNWELLMAAGTAIVNAVVLPPLNEPKKPTFS